MVFLSGLAWGSVRASVLRLYVLHVVQKYLAYARGFVWNLRLYVLHVVQKYMAYARGFFFSDDLSELLSLATVYRSLPGRRHVGAFFLWRWYDGDGCLLTMAWHTYLIRFLFSPVVFASTFSVKNQKTSQLFVLKSRLETQVKEVSQSRLSRFAASMMLCKSTILKLCSFCSFLIVCKSGWTKKNLRQNC